MLTDNMVVSSRLIKGSIGTVEHLDMISKPFCSAVLLKFDLKAGNSLKNRRLRGEVKEYVPITARLKRFCVKERQKYCHC